MDWKRFLGRMWAWDHGRCITRINVDIDIAQLAACRMGSIIARVMIIARVNCKFFSLPPLFVTARFVRGGLKYYWWSDLGISTWRPFVTIQRLVRISMAHDWSPHLRLCLLKAPLIFFSFLIKPACAAGKMHASKETPCTSTVTIAIAQGSNCKLYFQTNCDGSLH